MARTAIGSVAVDSTVLFIPTGDVHDWTEKVTRAIGREARLLCPPGTNPGYKRRATTRYVSTRAMRATIRTKTRMAGTRLDVGVASVGPVYNADGEEYSQHVLLGTAYQGTRYIYSHKGYPNRAIIAAVITRRGVRELGGATAADLQGRWVMRFRTDGGRHFRVHGQKRNPFMFSAYNRVARRHPDSLGELPLPYL